jgi:hypothetical protein
LTEGKTVELIFLQKKPLDFKEKKTNAAFTIPEKKDAAKISSFDTFRFKIFHLNELVGLVLESSNN